MKSSLIREEGLLRLELDYTRQIVRAPARKCRRLAEVYLGLAARHLISGPPTEKFAIQ